MSLPLVTCVMITADRPEFVARSIRMFQRQTYPNKGLLILNTGNQHDALYSLQNPGGLKNVAIVSDPGPQRTIGELRNQANDLTRGDILAHWDDDDLSHPNRIAEQVAFLQGTGARAVGYRSMLAWRHKPNWSEHIPCDSRKAYEEIVRAEGERNGETWLYTHPRSNYILGTSLVYWRRAWEQLKFPAWNRGEDKKWCTDLGNCYCCADSSVGAGCIVVPPEVVGKYENRDPRMIATIHGSNTSSAVTEFDGAGERVREWQRVPDWDGRVRQIIEGKEWE